MKALDKAKTLQQTAMEKRQTHRRKVWEKIQSDYPDCAEAIERVTRWSGRLAGVSVEVDGKEILNSDPEEK